MVFAFIDEVKISVIKFKVIIGLKPGTEMLLNRYIIYTNVDQGICQFDNNIAKKSQSKLVYYGLFAC